MGKKIALTSTGPLSGKTTLARYLHEHHGYLWADHSATLIELFVKQWNKVPTEHPLTVEDVLGNKEYWRPSLQDYGNRQGFNTDYQAARGYMEYTLSRVGALDTDQDVVYEPFRGQLQSQVLRDLGFFLIQIHIPEEVRRERAQAKKVSYRKIKASMDRAPELERGIVDPDMRLNGELSTKVMASITVHFGG